MNIITSQNQTTTEIKKLRSDLSVVAASGTASLAEQQAQTALLTTMDASLVALEAKSNLKILEDEANDLVQTFAYLDPGVADERVSTITYTSPTDFPAITVIKTFVYVGGAGLWRVETITLS